ncbi:MAG: hypothetical protein ACTHU0_22165 [Kofleriaceae bacterium]
MADRTFKAGERGVCVVRKRVPATVDRQDTATLPRGVGLKYEVVAAHGELWILYTGPSIGMRLANPGWFDARFEIIIQDQAHEPQPDAASIWLVWARRGDYSDTTEYVVCWFVSKIEADLRASEMQVASNEWRSRIADSDHPWELVEEAKKAIGDPGWSKWDDTTYSACMTPCGAGVNDALACAERMTLHWGAEYERLTKLHGGARG